MRSAPRTPRLLLLLLTCLALAATCVAAVGRAQSARPARDGVAQPEKSNAAGASRARRVADRKRARATQPAPSVSGKAAPASLPARSSAAARAVEPAAASVEPERGGESGAEAGANKPAAASDAAAPTLSAEDEVEKMRAELGGADAASRAVSQRALVDRLVALGRKDDALSELRLMLHEDRYDPAFFFNTGNALARLGDANAAADAYRKAVSQRRGNYSRALNNLGVVLTRQGRWDEAHDALAAALTQENLLYAEASYNLGRLYLLRGEANLAQREWARTLRLQPDHADAAAALARSHAEEGDERRASAVLENFTVRAARTGATVPRQIAYAREAIAASREDSREDAAPARPADSRAGDSAARGAAESNVAGPRPSGMTNAPRTTGHRFELDAFAYNVFQSARAAGGRGRHEEAARQYGRVISRSGGYFPPANLELGLALLNLQRTDEAIAALRPVAERDSARFPVSHYHLARLYEKLGRDAAAAEHFARAAELYGDANPQMLVDLSRVREKMGDARGALAAIEAYSVAIGRQGSVPGWVVERADALRMKLKSAPPQPAARP